VSSSAQFLNPAEAARRLGISTKALRLYEQRGLITPVRTTAGWRTYGPHEMARAAEIVDLRALGLSLAQVVRVMDGDPQSLEPALAAHQATLEGQARQLTETVEKVRTLRTDLAQGQAPDAGDLARMVHSKGEISVAFDLPWPWGGERFELSDIRPLNYILGPLGCGKTVLSMKIAEALPDAAYIGLERLDEDGAAARARMDNDPALKSQVDQTAAWLVEDGATESPALIALLVALEVEEAAVLVVDMVEQGLDHATQEALIAHLRHHARPARPVMMMTRSCAILDLDAVGPGEAIILCPANHSPPILVAPYPGAPGYESVTTCLASPEVRARTEGLISWRPEQP
jgi:DNA-binding transcriptional MerR regulator